MISHPTAILFHSVAGAALLVFYWRTLLSRKGSPEHRRLGRTYLILVIPLMISIVPITLEEVQRGSCNSSTSGWWSLLRAGRPGGPLSTAAAPTATAGLCSVLSLGACSPRASCCSSWGLPGRTC
ncbi:MAG TPA: hypothetical protein VH913_19690 [Hyphomicrobiaceae bacterium]|jgi:hypothetical protein